MRVSWTARGNPSRVGLLATSPPLCLFSHLCSNCAHNHHWGSLGWGGASATLTLPDALHTAAPPPCPPLSHFLMAWSSAFTLARAPPPPRSPPGHLTSKRGFCGLFYPSAGGYSGYHGQSAVPPALAHPNAALPGPQQGPVEEAEP